MKSQKLGKNTSVEVINVSIHGIWVFVSETEYFLPFKDFPWFQKATIEDIQNVELLNTHHLFWPKLDVDLDLAQLESPDKYPLVSK